MTIPPPMWSEATKAVDAAERLLLVTHFEPDGDAIGSLLGLGNALRARFKNVDMAVDGGVPSFADFLPGADTVLPKLDTGTWDLMISLDSSDEARSGECGVYGRANSRTVINVDHHPSNTLFGQVYVIVPTAVSTTEIVHDWLREMGQPLTLDIALPLLTGLVTDTLGFRTSNVTRRTLTLAEAFMDTGASLYDIVQRTLNSKSYLEIELWQRVLPSVKLDDGLISGVVRNADWQAVGLSDPTDGGLVSYLIATDEANIAVVYKERADGQVELGFRSKPGYDVSTVAVSLGGGGHKQASGALIAGPVEAAEARVTPLLRAALNVA